MDAKRRVTHIGDPSPEKGKELAAANKAPLGAPKIIILGVGKMGLLMNAILRLRGYEPIMIDMNKPVFERKDYPYYPFFFHKQVIPFTTDKKIHLVKTIIGGGDYDKNYSLKVYGIISDKVKISSISPVKVQETWELNTDLIQSSFKPELFMNDKLDVSKFIDEGKMYWNDCDEFVKNDAFDYLFSTIPLFSYVGREGNFFPYRDVYIKRTKTDVLYTEPNVVKIDYVTDLHDPVYRRTYYKDTMLEESTAPIFDRRVFAKSYDCRGDGELRKGVLAALQAKKVYCFGRFATWRPNVFLHQEITRFIRFVDKHLPLAVGGSHVSSW